ncbi:2-hydroxyacid dehydrogenase [Paramicrobacterium agarici]|uniref:D-3-phosphoglycerate dehydrogenase n=1 Tax=Paramicrobacterium agarici TaxID=630514 RepID=A0A2A9DVG5_9MICO|nr:2-hydroxyacid dehydrogenase [Microbacterium agarici]PFG29940.1 D-3-phosphoglycerate dehydrogenase [Microbacterium agarici]
MHVLSAGDNFVLPELFVNALRERTGAQAELTFSEVTFPWPQVPFGPVGNVAEATGTIDEMIEAVGNADIAVTQLAPFTKEVFDACPNLKFVGVSRGGPVNVDLEAATAASVRVSFAPGRNAQAAAEFTIGLMLAGMRHISDADAEMKRGTWRGDYYSHDSAGTELGGSTVGLVGYGAIGRIVARVLLAFGADVVTYDPYADAASIESDGVSAVSLDELIDRSNVVSLHARLSPETEHIINGERLLRMRPGTVLVNAARGGLLDYAPLPELLRSGHIGALALDVYDEEPPGPEWPLFDAPNVVLSPHLAGASRQTAERAASIIAGEAARFIAGEPLQHLANPDVLNR